MGKFIWISLLLLAAGSARAAGPFKIAFRSRALFDVAFTDYGKEDCQGYYRLEDFRVGFKATMGAYELKADVGLGGSKVAVKDLLLNRSFGHNVLSIGNGYEPYSMDMLISTVDMRFLQSASSVQAFAGGRKVGVTLHRSVPHWYLATGLYTNNDINKLGKDDRLNSFATTSRVVWRPLNAGGRVLHVGGAFSFRTEEANVPEGTTSERTVGSAGVTALLDAPLLEAHVDRVGTEAKGLVEFLAVMPRWLVQGEYFFNRLDRKEGKAYRPHGGYVQGSWLLYGKGYAYDAQYAVPGRPAEGRAWELTLRYNYTDLNDRQAGIFGGKEADLSLGVNYYLDKHLGLKLNVSHVAVGSGRNAYYGKDLWLGQLRMQYVF